MQMLYHRIINGGTINEPTGKPEPHFALPSTVHWMKSLALLVGDQTIDFKKSAQFYSSVAKRNMDSVVENTVLEQLFLSLHHLSALEKMKDQKPITDFARLGILGWYYGIANAASAMIAAQDNSFQEDHSGTAKVWDKQIASQGLALEPFGWRVSSLIEKIYKPEIEILRSGSSGILQVKPITVEDARGGAAGYLSGSAKWYAWRATEEVRKTSAFKQLNVVNFRTKAAQAIRDDSLSQRSIGFVHQASRYRGKANYREALFLAYGATTELGLQGFVEDQASVLRAFLAMAGAFASKKLGKSFWLEFVSDVEANRAFTTSAQSVWS